jgi:hypothetical protein
MADRYTYVPAVGICVLMTWTTAELVRRLRLPAPFHLPERQWF